MKNKVGLTFILELLLFNNLSITSVNYLPRNKPTWHNTTNDNSHELKNVWKIANISRR